jgi:hypothetical protein
LEVKFTHLMQQPGKHLARGKVTRRKSRYRYRWNLMNSSTWKWASGLSPIPWSILVRGIMVMFEEDDHHLQSDLSRQGIPESRYNPALNVHKCETTERWCNTRHWAVIKRGRTKKQNTLKKDGCDRY